MLCWHVTIRPLSWYSCSANFWSNINKTHRWKEQTKFSKCTNLLRNAIILKIVIFIRFCMVNRQGLLVQLICHTKPYNNHNFQNVGASWYFGLWLWELVCWPAPSSGISLFLPSFIGAVIFVIRAISQLCMYMWCLVCTSQAGCLLSHRKHRTAGLWGLLSNMSTGSKN